ncbi:methyl-accepting chemotaxis protein [Oleidesulfovibrio sp.]|uniref:methyl-accepting chemotaxis protein n=1 Tax=Oleidesulfovibrio sp. TaxID=2909707 RepID=UPI003A8A8460
MKIKLMGRFLLPTLTVLIVGMGVSSWLTGHYSQKAVGELVAAESSQVAKSLTDLIDMWVINAEVTLEAQANRSLFKDFFSGEDSEAAVTEALQQVAMLYQGFDSVKITNAQGLVIASTIQQDVGSVSARDRNYFKKVMRGEVAVSGALRSLSTGQLIFVVAVPVKVQGKVEGALLATLKLDDFSKQFVDPISIGKEGFAFILDSEGRILAHRDEGRIMSSVSHYDWAGKLFAKDHGLTRYEDEGGWKEVAFRRVHSTGWVVGISAYEHDVYQPSYELTTITRVISVVVALMVGAVILLIVRSIVGTIRESVTYAAAVAEGSLDQELHVQRTDEIGILADALRSMVANLKTMISTAEAKTAEAEEQTQKANIAMQEAEAARAAAEAAKREGMLQAAGQLEHVVLALSSASEQLAAQVEEASRGSDIQRERTAETATAIEEMNATVLEVARNASEAAESAEDARNNAEEGHGIVGNVIESITEVKNRSETLKASLHLLGEHAEGIGKIMTVITDIADQTNLLALNAAIEAARAGDAGRGFAVVADEVRKLAEKTMQATKEVGDAVSAIQQGARDNIEGMDSAGEAIQKSTELAGRAGKSLQAIHKVVENTADQVRSIATASEQQSAASEQIARSAEEVNRIADETSQVMTQSSEAVSELARMAQELQNVVEELKKG